MPERLPRAEANAGFALSVIVGQPLNARTDGSRRSRCPRHRAVHFRVVGAIPVRALKAGAVASAAGVRAALARPCAAAAEHPGVVTSCRLRVVRQLKEVDPVGRS